MCSLRYLLMVWWFDHLLFPRHNVISTLKQRLKVIIVISEGWIRFFLSIFLTFFVDFFDFQKRWTWCFRMFFCFYTQLKLCFSLKKCACFEIESVCSKIWQEENELIYRIAASFRCWSNVISTSQCNIDVETTFKRCYVFTAGGEAFHTKYRKPQKRGKIWIKIS